MVQKHQKHIEPTDYTFDRRNKNFREKLIIGILTTLLSIMFSGLGFMTWQVFNFSQGYYANLEHDKQEKENIRSSIFYLTQNTQKEIDWLWKDSDAQRSLIDKTGEKQGQYEKESYSALQEILIQQKGFAKDVQHIKETIDILSDTIISK